MTTPASVDVSRYIDEIARLNDVILQRDAMIEVLCGELEGSLSEPVNYWPVEELAALVAGDVAELVVSA